MKYLMAIIMLVAMTWEAEAQEYWSRIRDIDDANISKNVKPKDYDERRDEFERLCRLAYEAFDDGDYYMTAIYGVKYLLARALSP